MGFLNIVGCCCGGPGVVKCRTHAIGFAGAFPQGAFGSGVQPVNRQYDLLTDTGPLKHWPCWSVPFHDPPSVYTGSTAIGPLKALVAESDNVPAENYLYFNTERHSLINARGSTNVRELQLVRECRLAISTEVVNFVFQNGGGASPNVELISAVDGAAIIDGASTGSPVFKYGAFAGATNERLYGFSFANYSYYGPATGNYKFKAWSVAYDGTDFVDEFELSGDSGSGDPLSPVCMNVVDGDIWCISRQGVAPGDLLIYRNGSLHATMDRPTGDIFPLSHNAVTAIGAGRQAFVAWNVLDFGNTLRLSIVADGEALDDMRVRLITYLADAEDDIEFFPQTVSWDPDKKCAVVVWGNPTWGGYISYITKEIEPGNIVGQDGVLFYGAFASVGYDPGSHLAAAFSLTDLDYTYSNAKSWGVVIPGRMPQPLEVVEGNIVDPPPPPPEKTCDGLTECDNIAGAEFNLVLPDNYTSIIDFDAGFPFGELLAEWFPQSLSQAFDLFHVDGSTYTFELSLVEVDEEGDPITGDYDDAGLIIARKTVTDDITFPHTFREYWAYRIRARCTCSSGVVTILDVQWDVQIFDKYYTDDPGDPPTFIGAGGTVVPYTDPDNRINGEVLPCASTQMSAQLLFTSMLDGAPGDLVGWVLLTIGKTF